jgi:hypothetical protein
MKKRYVLTEFIERRIEEAGIDIELPDGTTVTIPPGELWPEETAPLLDADDYQAAAQVILGADEWARFVAAGGSWKLMNSILRDARGANAGE